MSKIKYLGKEIFTSDVEFKGNISSSASSTGSFGVLEVEGATFTSASLATGAQGASGTQGTLGTQGTIGTQGTNRGRGPGGTPGTQ